MKNKWLFRLNENKNLLSDESLAQSGGDLLIQILTHYEITEELSYKELYEQQLILLNNLVEHSKNHSRYFNNRLIKDGIEPKILSQPGGLQKLSVMSRQSIIESGKNLFCNNTPPAHGNVGATSTSGSTGEVVTIRKSELCLQHAMAGALREYLWHDRDIQGKLATIRANITKPLKLSNWGEPQNKVINTGTLEGRSSSHSIQRHAEWLLEYQPNQLLVYPSILNALIDALKESPSSLTELEHIRTFAESVSPELRHKTREFFDLEIVDIYSSEEFAILASQCPEEGNYHISETILIEVLNEDDNPCSEGEMGRVVVTDLLNYATPLIRYDIGDRAIQGTRKCACGRSSPTLQRILGRERNLVKLPDGTKHWPRVGFAKFLTILPIRQFQLIQDSSSSVTAKFYTQEANPQEKEDEISSIVQEALGHPFKINIQWTSQPLPRGANDKFEEFICLI